MATLAPASSEFVDALRRGLEAYDAGEIARASRLFDEALEIEPDNVWGLLWKGATAPTLGESKMWLQQAIALDAHNEHARAGLRWANEQLAGGEDVTKSMAPLTESVGTGTDEADTHVADDYADDTVDEDVATELDWLEGSAPPSASELDDFVTLLDRSESESGTAAEERADSDATSLTMEAEGQDEGYERESADDTLESTTEVPDVLQTENDGVELGEDGGGDDEGDASGLPDWLSERSSLTAELEEADHAEGVTELPDWLTDETSNGTGPLVAEETTDELAEAEPSLPDWLESSDMSVDEATDESLPVGEDRWATVDTTESTTDEPELTQPAELPDWLVDDVPTSAASTELPDWLTAEDTTVSPEQVSTHDEGQPSEGLPDWLTGDGSSEPTATASTDTAFPDSVSREALEAADAAAPADADLPDWLTGAGESTTSSVDVAELPDWLTGKAEPAVDTSDLPDWLAGSAAPTGEAVGELPSWLLGDDSTPFQATRGQGSLAPSDEVVEAYQAGLWAYEEDRLDDATRAFQRVIRLDPGHVEAHNYLGSVFYLNGRQDDAIVALRRALELDPVHSESYLNLGLVYKETGRNSQAVQMFNRYLDLAPADDTTTEYVREMIGQLGG